MEVTLYYRADIQACKGARRILRKLADEYALHISEVTVEPGSGIKAPAIGVEGSRLQVLDSSRGTPTEKTMRAYLELARVAGGGSRQTMDHGRRTMDDVHPSTFNLQPSTFKRFMWQHRVGMIVGALSAFLGLAWIAPVFNTVGMKDVYAAIFSAYRLVCVQTPERSPYVGEHPCCLCWRCVAIYAGSLLFGILYTLGRDGRLPRMRWLTGSVGLAGLIIFSLPMFADGLSHTFGLRAGPEYAYSPDFWLGWGEMQADWLVRVATSLLATVGAVKFLCPRLDKIGARYDVGATTSELV